MSEARPIVAQLGFSLALTICVLRAHRIEQNYGLGGPSINKGCAVHYYSVTQEGITVENVVSCRISSKAALQT